MGTHDVNDVGAGRREPQEEQSSEGDHPGNAEYFHADLSLLADPDAEGHEQEWARTVEYYAPWLDRHFMRDVPEKADREDLAHDIWATIIPLIGTLKHPAAMWSWLAKTGRNRLIDQARKRKSARRAADKYPDSVVAISMSQPTPDALTILASDGHPMDLSEIEEHLVGLSDDERQLLMLRAAGRSHDEIAVEMNLKSAQTSSKRLERVLKKIRKSLGIV